MHKPTSPRPDLIDSLVALWLSSAVCVASVMTAPIAAQRAPWPAPNDPTPEPDVDAAHEPDAPCGCAAPPSLVSNVRPDDAGAVMVVEPGTTETCRDCRFYAAVTSMAGECRRFAPDMGMSTRGEWPIAEARSWCGMHVPALIPAH